MGDKASSQPAVAGKSRRGPKFPCVSPIESFAIPQDMLSEYGAFFGPYELDSQEDEELPVYKGENGRSISWCVEGNKKIAVYQESHRSGCQKTGTRIEIDLGQSTRHACMLMTRFSQGTWTFYDDTEMKSTLPGTDVHSVVYRDTSKCKTYPKCTSWKCSNSNQCACTDGLMNFQLKGSGKCDVWEDKSEGLFVYCGCGMDQRGVCTKLCVSCGATNWCAQFPSSKMAFTTKLLIGGAVAFVLLLVLVTIYKVSTGRSKTEKEKEKKKKKKKRRAREIPETLKIPLE